MIGRNTQTYFLREYSPSLMDMAPFNISMPLSSILINGVNFQANKKAAINKISMQEMKVIENHLTIISNFDL
jgi:hypothetical protein